jgi:hypothetical protein
MRIERVALRRLPQLVPRARERSQLLQRSPAFGDDSLRLFIEGQFFVGDAHIALDAIRKLQDRVPDAVDVGFGDRASQPALARERQPLPQPQHLHRHVVAPQAQRLERSVDDPEFQHRVVERARRRDAFPRRLVLALRGRDLGVVGERFRNQGRQL